jgi:hypothetical protein
MDELLQAEEIASKIETMADELAGSLPRANRETALAVSRIRRNARSIQQDAALVRRNVAATMAVA